MKVLFFMRSTVYVRNFDSALRLLCDRGHHVHIAFRGTSRCLQLDPIGIARQLASEYPSFAERDNEPRDSGWGLLGRDVRLALYSPRLM
ncbi:MAG: hypothetical protein A3I61_09325 [Acidobacteria bacterium RIFCSPLOWO2_02_FULL_68_18]|nr:MAG: hypothetical protein A3I61_09325 [Acidobacteria bacterium RIFCSPLOWO2_02_FULL_68_18]OFW51092.1 MAG: hypothetical protein A3G77_15830 [Acidobacteria bacterium RIFCSPLOWO2_12_FULL_68_19]